jgi:hypothetical protein
LAAPPRYRRTHNVLQSLHLELLRFPRASVIAVRERRARPCHGIAPFQRRNVATVTERPAGGRGSIVAMTTPSRAASVHCCHPLGRPRHP